MQQLETLSEQNASLITTNQLLHNQILTLQIVKEQIQALSEEDDQIDIDIVFLNTSDYELLKIELLEIGSMIWENIQTKISSILSKPWEALANKDHNDQVLFLTEENETLKKENQDLKKQIISKLDVFVCAPSIFVKTTKPHFDFDPLLQSLKDYEIFDEIEQSIDSKVSFKFQPVQQHSITTSIKGVDHQKPRKSDQDTEEGAKKPEEEYQKDDEAKHVPDQQQMDIEEPNQKTSNQVKVDQENKNLHENPDYAPGT